MGGEINMKWKKLSTKIIFWLTMEIFLSYLGIDHLADYGEFLLTKNTIILIN